MPAEILVLIYNGLVFVCLTQTTVSGQVLWLAVDHLWWAELPDS